MTNKHAIHKRLTTHNSQLTKYAFTLAETLIVMGIIGVVAALTLPNLNSSTGDKEKVVKVKKIYQNLNDAFGRAKAIYGPVSEWTQEDLTEVEKSARQAQRLLEFLKVSKDCSSKQGCWHNSVTLSLNGDTKSIAYGNNFDKNTRDYRLILADGTAININQNFWIDVDIDGPNKGPNVMGKDIFAFGVADDELYPFGSDKVLFEKNKYPDDCFNTGSSCARWVIDNGNMDYLKVDSNGKCPDGKTVLDGTTNTACK